MNSLPQRNADRIRAIQEARVALVRASAACADSANVDAYIWRADAELLAAIRETVWPSHETVSTEPESS